MCLWWYDASYIRINLYDKDRRVYYMKWMTAFIYECHPRERERETRCVSCPYSSATSNFHEINQTHYTLNQVDVNEHWTPCIWWRCMLQCIQWCVNRQVSIETHQYYVLHCHQKKSILSFCLWISVPKLLKRTLENLEHHIYNGSYRKVKVKTRINEERLWNIRRKVCGVTSFRQRIHGDGTFWLDVI